MQDLANIRKYKKGQALKGFQGLRGQDVDQVKELGVFKVVADEIEKEFDKLRKSLKDHKHTTAKSSMNLEQSIGSDIAFKENSGKIEVTFNASDQIGEYLDKGTRKAKGDKPSYDMLDSLYTWGNTRGIFNTAQGKKKQRSLAYGMARSILRKGIIKRYGYKGSKWATSVLGANNELLEMNLTKAISEALGKSVEVQVTKQANDMLNGNNSK